VNGRAMAVTATGAIVLVALGVAVRPALPGSQRPQHGAVASPPVVSPVLVESATRAAVMATACASRAATRTGCGRLTVTDTNAYYVNASTVTVLVVGAVHETGSTTPVALRVEMHRNGSAWSTAVSTP
jgi:hypothetical protein